jgi:hypothetical protein
MEKLLETDIRVKNAKIRLQERGTKIKANDTTTDDTTKRRRLDELEDQAMQEDDPVKLNEIFETYRTEYLKARSEGTDATKRLKTGEGPRLQECASGSQQPAVYAEMEVAQVYEDGDDPWQMVLKEKPKDFDFEGCRKKLQRQNAGNDDERQGDAATLWNCDEGQCLTTLEGKLEKMLHRPNDLFFKMLKNLRILHTTRAPTASARIPWSTRGTT